MPDLKILGDPHLGRTWSNSVPLHRRGDRERMVRDQFVKELDPGPALLHVCMGDIFDNPNADLDTIWFAASSYVDTANMYPEVTFVVIRGNHDEHRDLTRVSAFKIFKGLVAECGNIMVVDDWDWYGEYHFFGWHPTESAADLVRGAFRERQQIGLPTPRAVFGHWDTDTRVDPHNLIPTAILAEYGVTKVYNGHIHLPDQFKRDGVEVNLVGSMQPYAHGEDAGTDWYITLTKEELSKLDPASLKDKCVRITLLAGEAYDVELDCLQLKYERAAEADNQDTGVEVKMEGFDLQKLFEASMTDVSKEVGDKVRERWLETFTT